MTRLISPHFSVINCVRRKQNFEVFSRNFLAKVNYSRLHWKTLCGCDDTPDEISTNNRNFVVKPHLQKTNARATCTRIKVRDFESKLDSYLLVSDSWLWNGFLRVFLYFPRFSLENVAFLKKVTFILWHRTSLGNFENIWKSLIGRFFLWKTSKGNSRNLQGDRLKKNKEKANGKLKLCLMLPYPRDAGKKILRGISKRSVQLDRESFAVSATIPEIENRKSRIFT